MKMTHQLLLHLKEFITESNIQENPLHIVNKFERFIEREREREKANFTKSFVRFWGVWRMRTFNQQSDNGASKKVFLILPSHPI